MGRGNGLTMVCKKRAFTLGTCLASFKSHLFPTKILNTPSFANLSISFIHDLTCSNDVASDISYTITIP